MAGLISFDQALALIAARVGALAAEVVPLGLAAGRTLAEPLRARASAPPRAVSAMDGYAVIAEATRPGQWQRLGGESRPGTVDPGTIAAGEAMRIFTGGPLPVGADCVIMQEYAERSGEQVRFAAGYGPARHVRAAASDFAVGDVLLDAGTRLDSRAMIAAAAADQAAMAVIARPRVAILGTGDELAPPGEAWQRPGTIPESVTFGIAAGVAAAGGEVIRRTICGDDLATLQALAGQALEDADLVVVAGGASVGERDFAKAMFAVHGLDLAFSKVAIKPGMPVWFGLASGRWVLGLPGNPTSAMVTAALFLHPVLALLQGRPWADALRWRRLPLATALAATSARETFVRARWDDQGLVPVTNQDSGAQAALVRSDWLIRCAAGSPARPAGDMVTALAF